MTGKVRPWLGPSIPFAIDEVDEASRTWSWHVRLGIVDLHLDHFVTAIADGSATKLTIRGPAVLVLPYAPIAQLALNRLVR